ncbi:hypothetical protein [Aestuariispira insulae]|uniref:Molybdopterin-dependent oxidoreductase-like protein n=1 Tax=Aestuariispira insulae TaxID=1461337 RepID=A0A3D9HRY2_9PROT|nr:hypothetical protein [Aestuariispira insulae]RED52273.1 hypothetical protein DFP90_102291 [Aestuariispira insulae]
MKAILSAILLLTGLVWTPALALDKPKSMVILTIGGQLENANRGALQPKRDAFINGQDQTFSKAAEFDRSMLADLGLDYVKVGFKDWPRPYGLRGPKLNDVLKAAGVSRDATIAVTALDGWTFEITPEMRADNEWILAIQDGEQPLGIGQRGPTWLVFKPADPDGMATEEEEGQWVWSVYLMQVQ